VARYRQAIFDFDGTLADTFPWFTSVLDGVADRFGFRRVGDELERLRGADTRALLQHFAVPMWKLPMIAAHMRSLAAARVDEIRLFDGARATLHELHEAGVDVAVVSSNAADTIRHVLGPKTAALVSQFECGASLFGKPTKIKKVLRRTGVAPADSIYIGDELRDGEAARGVGMAFGAVAWGYASPEALTTCAPDALFHSFEELLRGLLGFDDRTQIPAPRKEARGVQIT
jgi:phosphoglycolate phosphatase